MKSIAFSIQKGGTGKSSSAGNIGYILGLTNKTILVDADPQGNSSSWFIKNKDIEFELADVLLGKCEISQALIHIKHNFYVLPSFSIGGALREYAQTKIINEPFIFDDFNKGLELLDFDYALYDLSPSRNFFEKCILMSMEEIITPLLPKFFSWDGIEIFTTEINKISKAYRRPINHSTIILNMKNQAHKSNNLLITKLKEFDYNYFEIGQNIIIDKSQSQHIPIFEWIPKKEVMKTIKEYTEIANYIRS